MNVLVVGALGNMGRRYCAIVEYLGHKVVPVDIEDCKTWLGLIKFDKAIIATPTDKHFQDCFEIAGMKKPFLCEKPISKHPNEIQKLIDTSAEGYMVNNWCFVAEDAINGPGTNRIEYDFYNTGQDELVWDMIQPLYLASGYSFYNKSPAFKCYINDLRITLDDFCYSYINMVKYFLDEEYHKLWTMKDALAATNKVIKEIKKSESTNTSKVNV